MSFSSETKTSICTCPVPLCCRRAMLSGMLVFSNICTSDKVKLITENEDVANLFTKLLYDLCSVRALVHVSKRKTSTEGDIETDERKKCNNYKITVTNKKDIVKLSSLFSSEFLSYYHINPAILKCASCKKAFFKGAFLFSGTVSNPSLSYHCEISTPYKSLSEEMVELLSSVGLSTPKTVVRKSSVVIYYKGSERIVDFFNYIGASSAAFDIMNSKIKKDIINNTNRIVNCETANIGKVILAAREVIEAIEYLQKTGKIENLPDSLKQTAKLRMENTEATIAELGQMMTPPLSKSGVNHRLKKIIEFRKKSDG